MTQIRLPALHTKQKEVVSSKARFKVVAAGRRWGKSRLGTIVCLKTAIRRGGVVWWVAPTYKLAEIGWRTLKQVASQIPGVNIREGDREIEFPGGGLVAVRSADDPHSLRGWPLDGVVLDECAFMKPAAWYEALRPALSDRKGWAVFISTPNGKDGLFHKVFGMGLDRGQDEWESWRFPTSTNPYIDAFEIEAARLTLPERVFRQEYLAEFGEGSGAVFRGVEAVSILKPQSGPCPGHRYVAGVDFARSEDFTVISVFDSTLRCQAYLDRFNQINWELQRGRIIEAWRRWGLSYVLAEANSIGGPNIEALMGAGVPVESFTTTSSSKAMIIDSLALAIERGAMGVEEGSVKLLDDPVQKHELEAYELERLASGQYRYGAPSGGHDDTVMASALAYRAAMYSGLSIRFA